MHQDKFKNMAISWSLSQHSYHLPAFNQLSQIQDQTSELKCLSHILSSQSIKLILVGHLSGILMWQEPRTIKTSAISDLPDATVDSFPNVPP